MNQPTFRVVILLLLLSSTLTLVISLGGNYWLRTVEFNQGLWKECRPNEDCVDITTHNYEGEFNHFFFRLTYFSLPLSASFYLSLTYLLRYQERYVFIYYFTGNISFSYSASHF